MSDEAPIKRVLGERLSTASIVGFALCIAWLLLALRTTVLLSNSVQPLLLHVPLYLFLTGSATVTLLLGGIFQKMLAKILINKIMPYLPASMMIAATILMLIITQTKIESGVLLAGICGIAAGLGFGLQLFQWGSVWYVMDFRSIVLSAVIAWCLCGFIFCLFLLFDQIAAVIGSAVMPLGSVLLLRHAKLHVNPVPPFGRTTDTAPHYLIFGLAILGFAYGLINEFARLTYIQRGAASMGRFEFAGTNGLALLFLLVVVGVTVLLPLILRREMKFETPYRIVLVLGVMGVLLLLLPEQAPFVSYAINMTAYFCLGFTLWSATICLRRRYPHSSFRVFGFTQAAWVAGPLVGAQGNHILYEMNLLPPSEITVVVGVSVMILVYCFVFKETDIALITMEGRTGGLTEQCAQIVWRFHLSERESQVLVHLAKGRDAKWIEEELCLSRSTVSTHRQHIYEKLGIHTRRELINLIESIDGM